MNDFASSISEFKKASMLVMFHLRLDESVHSTIDHKIEM